MKQEIAIKYCNGLIIPDESIEDNPGYSLSLVSEMMGYGFIPNEALGNRLSELSKESIVQLHKEVLPILKASVGAHVKHKPFYPNFPKQVMEASDWELYRNALAHTEDMVEAFVSLDNKITLGELFELHAKARGTLVEDKDTADIVFGIDGDLTPYDITEINSEYL